MYIYHQFGLSTLTTLFWFKALIMILIYYLSYTYIKHEFYYYRNLGISTTFLYSASLAINMLVFVLCIFLVSKR